MEKLKKVLSLFRTPPTSAQSKTYVVPDEKIVPNPLQTQMLLAKIEELSIRARFHSIDDQLVDACEITHYALVNDEPVRISHVKLIDPEFDFSSFKSVLEGEDGEYYEELEERDDGVKVDDPYGVRPNDGSRGREDPTNWENYEETGPFGENSRENGKK